MEKRVKFGRARWSAFLAVLLVLVLVTGCTTTETPAGPGSGSEGGSQEQGTETETGDGGEAAKMPTEVKIGAIYPMSGGSATTGQDLANGVNLAVEIINGNYPDLNLPLAAGEGLTNLGGAKVAVVFGDHQANPEKGQSEAERLVTQEKVTALLGSYNSAVTATASQVAEQYRIPFLNPESTSPTLITRGFKWFFRTTPDDQMFSENFFQFLDDLKEKGMVEDPKLAILAENTLWGADVANFEEQYAEEYGYEVAANISYTAKGTNLDSEVQRLKASGANVLLQASYGSDAILSMRTYKQLDFNVDGLLAMDAGFVDSKFLPTMGEDAEGVLSREVWALDLGQQKPLVEEVNTMFREKYGTDMNGNSARAFTGMLTLADAINRAGSTDPEAIRQALLATDIPGDQLIMPWQGVKFDPETGQNVKGSGIIVQAQNGKYVTVWPWDLAASDLIWPMPAWAEK